MRLKLSDTKVYEPQIRARLGTTARSLLKTALAGDFEAVSLNLLG